MNVIYLDSSSTDLAVGLSINGVLVDCVVKNAWQRQSELMIPELDEMMKRNNIDRTKIDEIVVGIGPGSYTGVRIALTIAKVMACTLDIPLYTVSSLRIRKSGNKPSICVINARSNRSYIGVYKGNETLMEDTIMSNDEVIKYISEHKDYFICGESSHLNITATLSNVIQEMHDLKPSLIQVEDKLGLKPIYMKD